MSSRLDRLMRLAQKTGDTLIIHDRVGRDMVLLDVDRYEMMIDDDSCMSFNEGGIHELSEGEMLDKINRDIAVWRSHEEEDEQGHRARVLERDMRENPLPDPFEEDFSHSSDWHKAGSVLEDRHPRFGDFKAEDKIRYPNYRFGSSAEPDFGPIVPYFGDDDDMYDEEEEDDDDFDSSFDPLNTKEDPNFVYDSLTEDSHYDTREKKDIPYVEHGSVETRTDDLGDDEPVFFEEPV